MAGVKGGYIGCAPLLLYFLSPGLGGSIQPHCWLQHLNMTQNAPISDDFNAKISNRVDTASSPDPTYSASRVTANPSWPSATRPLLFSDNSHPETDRQQYCQYTDTNTGKETNTCPKCSYTIEIYSRNFVYITETPYNEHK